MVTGFDNPKIGLQSHSLLCRAIPFLHVPTSNKSSIAIAMTFVSILRHNRRSFFCYHLIDS
jgi:hypothetical protein